MPSPKPQHPLHTRRAFIACGLSSMAAALLVSCGGSESTSSSGGPGGSAGGGAGGGSGAGGSGAGSSGSSNAGGTSSGCTLYPQQTEGPFYLDLDSVRADITEGKPGTPLDLTLRVISATTCAPLAGVAVDIWHCDADGVYSGFPGQLGGLDTTGEKFFRGTQLTDSEGKVAFTTIYPGWYPGRTTHVHFKVHPTANTEATSQLYFPEATNAEVYATAPYSTHGQKDTSNAGDATSGGVTPLVEIATTSAGYAATLDISVAG